MELLIPDWRDRPDNVGALTTLRQGGASLGPYGDGQGGGGLNLGVHVQDAPEHVAHNRRLLRSILPSEPAWLTQVHGVNVADAADVQGAPEADACIATQAGVVCAMMTADCLPVLFCDAAGKVVGSAHAGWRGLASGVLERTVNAMRGRGAGEILAWLGPAIGPEKFEVGQDVLDAFVSHDAASRSAFAAIAGREGKFLADIYQLARLRLGQVGVTRVSGGGFCTVSDTRFYSYRRDKVTGRMASLIWLR
ncbi:peptidoglycan editing factor PgeF [Herbaspirillum rhizosphaerae]|uniref:peptidoglycan editing factor PgeF n=1 Tax=Herbaspirillum rhizosphaerae TaxID=346179 RepID=UPI00067AAF6D|nr:peptidoglycan editing factor PgeF [Herbaspirillum rhizosphaerae]